MMSKWKFNKRRLKRKLWVETMLRYLVYLYYPIHSLFYTISNIFWKIKDGIRYAKCLKPVRNVWFSVRQFLDTYVFKTSFARSYYLYKYIEKRSENISRKDIKFIDKELLRIEGKIWYGDSDFISDKENWLQFRENCLLMVLDTDSEYYKNSWDDLAHRIHYCSDRWNQWRLQQVKFAYFMLREKRLKELEEEK